MKNRNALILLLIAIIIALVVVVIVLSPLGKASVNYAEQETISAFSSDDNSISAPTFTPDPDDIVTTNDEGLEWHFISLEITENSYKYTAEVTNNTSRVVSGFSYIIRSGITELGGGEATGDLLPGEKRTFGGGANGIDLPMDPEKINIVATAQFK